MNNYFKNSCRWITAIAFLVLYSVSPEAQDTNTSGTEQLRILSTGGCVTFVKSLVNGKWGISIEHPGGASAQAWEPIQIEHYRSEMRQDRISSGYSLIEKTTAGITGTGQIVISDRLSLDITDRWMIHGNQLHLERNLKVSGNAQGGFFSEVCLSTTDTYTLPDVDVFMPGMIYGRSEYLYDFAPAGRNNYSKGDQLHRNLQAGQNRKIMKMIC